MLFLNHYLIVSAVLFTLSLVGVVVHRGHLIMLLMCIELMLLSVSTNFVALAHSIPGVDGEVFVFFILAVAAAESAIGLAILVTLFRQRNSIESDALNTLKG